MKFKIFISVVLFVILFLIAAQTYEIFKTTSMVESEIYKIKEFYNSTQKNQTIHPNPTGDIQ